MRRYGYEIGMAFQIIDDILDFTGDQATIGKPVGSDLRQGIVTLPVLHFVDAHPSDPLCRSLREGICLEDEQADRLINAIRNSRGHPAQPSGCRAACGTRVGKSANACRSPPSVTRWRNWRITLSSGSCKGKTRF